MTLANKELEKQVEIELAKIWARTSYVCLYCGAKKKIAETMNHDKKCIYSERK